MENRFSLRVTNDQSLTLFDALNGESYKSAHAADTESRAIFIQPGLLCNPAGTEHLNILELGFGIGTNTANLIKDASNLKKIYKSIQYTSVDTDLTGAHFFQANSALTQLLHKKALFIDNFLQINLLENNFLSVLGNLASASIDVVFFDPFSPKCNPDSWSLEIFQECFRVLKSNGRLLTYSVSRIAKDHALAAGFQIQKFPLPKILHKRSALLAIKS